METLSEKPVRNLSEESKINYKESSKRVSNVTISTDINDLRSSKDSNIKTIVVVKESKKKKKMNLDKMKLLYNSLQEYFYNNKKILDIILPIINGKSKISLRLIDWVMSKLSKLEVMTTVKEDGKIIEDFGEYYDIYIGGDHKEFYDPFKRGKRINFPISPDKMIISTLGQVNALRMAIEFGVITKIEENLKDYKYKSRIYHKFMRLANELKKLSKMIGADKEVDENIKKCKTIKNEIDNIREKNEFTVIRDVDYNNLIKKVKKETKEKVIFKANIKDQTASLLEAIEMIENMKF